MLTYAIKSLAHRIIPSVAAMIFSTAVAHAAPIYDLTVKNADTQELVLTLQNDDFNCWEHGDDLTQLGEVWHIPPGGQARIVFARVSGHGCDGKNGEFTLNFNPGVNEKTKMHFQYTNDGGLSIDMGRANVYPAKLLGVGTRGNHYSYQISSVRLHEPVTAGNAVGHWTAICENICNYQHVHTVATTTSTSKTYSQEEKTAITTSLESKLTLEDVGGISSKITTEQARTIGKQMSESFSRNETFSDADNYVFSPEQMRDFKIYAIWQWVADTKLSTGEVVTVRSRSFTCTPDGNPPNYPPGAPQAIKACRGG